MKNIIEKVFNNFSNIENEINAINTESIEFNKARQALNTDLELINRWRVEILSNRQSIYVIGNFGTGKSTFHNFLLDLPKETTLFKESTKTETAVLQTLQHTLKEKARAELHIKDIKNFIKIEFNTIYKEISVATDWIFYMFFA